MRRWMGLMVCAASAGAMAQVVLTANAPQYNFQVLAGSQRQISVKLTGGTTNKINWSVLSATGGASATLDRGANAPGVTNVTIGPAVGACSITGGIGTYKVTSPATVTVQAQSVDDLSKKVTFLFNVCANTTSVDLVPAYQQAYKGQPVEIQTWVSGNTNQAGTWSIVSQPAGGNGTLADTNKRDALFSATVTGRYTLKYTSAADGSKSATATVYVSPNALPSYKATTSLTQPTECYADPQLSGKVYDVGPGLAFTTIRSVPTNNWAPGSIMRVHNVDTTGKNPTTYHESTRLISNGTPTQPLIMCGVPDAAGNLPIIDGINAQSPPWANGYTQPYGIVSLWGAGQYNGLYKDGSAGPNYMIISGLAIAHAGTTYNFIPLTGGAPLPYSDGASCIDIRSGTHLLIEGNDMNFCSNGLFVANNGQNTGFSTVTRYVDVRGNRMRNSSSAGAFGTHDAYVQSWFSVIEGNRFESLVAGSHGDALKDRGTESIIRYNLFNAQVANQLINFQSSTDAESYIAFEPYLGAAGITTCKAWYCNVDNTVSADLLTAWQEHLEKDFVYGNIFSGRTFELADINYGDCGGSNAPFDNATEMADHQGRLYFYNNTEDQPELAVFATLTGFNNGGDPQQQFMKPTVIAANNILYRTKQQTNIFAFARNASVVGVWQTNLMNLGTFSNAAPIAGSIRDWKGVNGWDSYTDQNQYPLDVPIDGHQTGLTAANFLTTPQSNMQPYNPVTFAPVPGAGAIGAGTPITDPWASLLPVRSQYSTEQAATIARTSLTTIGAVDTGGQPTLVSITPTAQSLAALSTLSGPSYTVGVALTLNCLYSNGMSTDCGPAATAVPTSPALTIVDGNKIITQTTGYGTLTANLGGVSSPPMVYSINGASGPAPATPSVVQVVLSPLSSTLTMGGTQQMTATATYSDASVKGCTPTTWSSSAPAVVTVTSGGLASATSGGSALITAVCSGVTSVASTLTVAASGPVTPPPVVPPPAPTIASVAISPATLTVLAGDTQQLTAMATYTDASIKACAATGWTSSAPAVATVSSAGLVSAVAKGTGSVTATCGGVVSSPVSVSVSATRVKVWTMRPTTTA